MDAINLLAFLILYIQRLFSKESKIIVNIVFL